MSLIYLHVSLIYLCASLSVVRSKIKDLFIKIQFYEKEIDKFFLCLGGIVFGMVHGCLQARQ